FIASPHYPLLKDALEAGGLKFVCGGMATGVVLPDGRSLVFSQSREENVAAMNALSPSDGDAYRAAMADVEREAPLIFTALGQEPWSWPTGKVFLKALFRRGPRELGAFIGEPLPTHAARLERRVRPDLL